MNTEEVTKIIDDLYTDYDAWSISSAQEDVLPSFNRALVYDESDIPSFAHALEIAKPTPDDIFYDLGSAFGKKVIAAGLLYKLKKSVGIEIQPLYHSIAETVSEACQSIYAPETPMEFYNCDYYSVDFSEATIVHLSIVPAMAMFQLSGELGKKLQQLRIGARFILTELPAEIPNFRFLEEIPYVFSGGERTAYIHEKIA